VNIEERQIQGVPALIISGEVDLQHSPDLRAALRVHSKARRPVLLVDFANVTYLDSSGLATLVEYYQTSRQFGGKIALYNLAPRIRNVLEIARLDRIFSVYPDEASALSSLRP
jgi:anti-sigma B factor antagonist